MGSMSPQTLGMRIARREEDLDLDAMCTRINEDLLFHVVLELRYDRGALDRKYGCS